MSAQNSTIPMPPSTGRALVACQAGTGGPSAPTPAAVLPDAGFLAQVLASQGQGTMYRRLRRAEPATALARYGARAGGDVRGKTVLVA
jgi:hypothetical protein